MTWYLFAVPLGALALAGLAMWMTDRETRLLERRVKARDDRPT